ncbi:isochorismate synthase [Aggregatimonas sangjinii]|uniref:Isochorismate synthase n=1 Tax=Aggregatimonas sangjinii TaxID=2583587 RepID=A0A5B7STE7_9FLAO|nr:chorismate-binding protein [Aggregatimonas sangjinii]QCX00191.1 isochorismate synthase [Aggregatimonas sangjinii]
MFPALKARINEQLANGLPFVAYRKPNSDAVIGIFQSSTTVHKISDYSSEGFIFAPFDDIGHAVLIPLHEKIVATDYRPKVVPPSPKFQVDSTQRDFHIQLVQKGISEIKKGHFKKVVLSRRFQVEAKDSPIELLENLLSSYTSAFCYLWYHPGVGTWLGATPEILLRTVNKEFATMSLAGTKALQADNASEWGAKELEEQALVTDYIEKALNGKVANLSASGVETLRAGILLHLRTKITGQSLVGLQEIIEALHPTPAVCGLPLMAAKEFILQQENYDRQFYTGFLGELNFKRTEQRSSNRKNQENQAYKSVKRCSELFVNLRCMQLLEDKALIYVGGGITVDSVPEKEWQETVNKSSTMLKVLQNVR